MIHPNQRILKPSQEIREIASVIYQQKNGKPLLSYQSAPISETIEALLAWLDDHYLPREVSISRALLDSQPQEEDDKDSQPKYR